MRTHDFRPLPDLASRTLAGSVVYANDELFAERENLIKPEPAVFSTETFGHKGKIYDGWETRRRREAGFDYAIVRLGVPGIIHGIVVDTAWFKGNYPPFVSVEATSIEGFPTIEELHAATWVTLVEKSEVKGDSENPFDVSDRHRFTHVRLTIYPDGGVARLRVHGDPMPDPRLLTGTVDLAGLENGGSVIDCSNMFYSSPLNILRPDRAHNMGDGWENARRRDSGNDHVTVKLAARGSVRRIEIDTSYFIGNSAGWASVRGIDASCRRSRRRLGLGRAGPEDPAAVRHPALLRLGVDGSGDARAARRVPRRRAGPAADQRRDRPGDAGRDGPSLAGKPAGRAHPRRLGRRSLSRADCDVRRVGEGSRTRRTLLCVPRPRRPSVGPLYNRPGRPTLVYTCSTHASSCTRVLQHVGGRRYVCRASALGPSGSRVRHPPGHCVRHPRAPHTLRHATRVLQHVGGRRYVCRASALGRVVAASATLHVGAGTIAMHSPRRFVPMSEFLPHSISRPRS